MKTPMIPWQPMSAAPRDGTPIIVVCRVEGDGEPYAFEAHWGFPTLPEFKEKGRYLVRQKPKAGFIDSIAGTRIDPWLWIPKPPLPKEAP